jgi:hypothetical protein
MAMVTSYDTSHYAVFSLRLPFPFSEPLIKHVHYKGLQCMKSDRQINGVEATLHLKPELT